jgi:hypothetical protein
MASAAANSKVVSPPQKLATHWRVLITIALLAHLSAITVAPWSGPEPAGPLVAMIARPFGTYLDATYSGHGYRFFAPAPGPSHLVRYTLTMPDGTSKTETFPNKQTEWPRLFYHRHFMLSEKLNGLFDSDEPGPNDPPEAHAEWQAMRDTFNQTARSYAMHLLVTTGAAEIKLELVRHNIPFPQQVAAGLKLDDTRTYQVLWTSPTYKADSL